ncbi:hypothetical protein Acr_23g0008070 [Actinidia rufa]|uniref:Uncharacterized protein n=1 Tax=Actinidia rufa TaxID=165716 RepID=A0A7J0GNQ1_9ERIC|nr:hypothetical protein Acr_23g0008070 [Actinidia rufa]
MLSIFATSDDPSPIQVATSILLTGAISVFLFRSLRRRAKRVKELKFRSSGAKKSLKEEAIESLKAMTPAAVDARGPPSVRQLCRQETEFMYAYRLYLEIDEPSQHDWEKLFMFFVGRYERLGVAALSVWVLVPRELWTVQYLWESNAGTVLHFQVRQITVTIRTIVNGICYLATCVFGINSVGLFLYSAKLAFNFVMEDSSSKGTENEVEAQITPKNPSDVSDMSIGNEDQSSDSTQ